MRKSTRVTLVLIGLTTLGGCGQENRRDVYRTREDCLADWGNQPEDCSPATEKRHAGTGFWYGPYYAHRPGFGSNWSRSGSASSSRIGSGRSIGSSSSSTSRGGFGSSSRSSAS